MYPNYLLSQLATVYECILLLLAAGYINAANEYLAVLDSRPFIRMPQTVLEYYEALIVAAEIIKSIRDTTAQYPELKRVSQRASAPPKWRELPQ